MGKHSAGRRKRSFLRKNRIAIAAGAVILLLITGIVTAAVVFSNPYRGILTRAGVSTEQCKRRKGVLSLTFEGDSEGILSCRKALNALRAEKAPHTVEWCLVQEGNEILSGKIEQVGYIPAATSPRVETLAEDLTLLKLKYELEQSGLTVDIAAEKSVGINGKTVNVTVHTPKDSLARSATPVSAAIDAVNAEGGGIARCNILFQENGKTFAVASYDLIYQDTLFSSQFYKD